MRLESTSHGLALGLKDKKKIRKKRTTKIPRPSNIMTKNEYIHV